MSKRLLTAFFALCAFSSFAQDYSNKGKDFWICYPAHIDSTNSAMGIYITSDVNATGQIDVAGTIVPFSVTANTVTYKFIGPNASGSAANNPPYLNQQDGIKAGAGIHVTSDKDIAVYAHIIRSARSGATLVLPTKVWGKEYVVPSHRNTGNTTGYGEITVMASIPNTVVEITPAVTTRSGRPANVPFQITLANPGDVYQLQFTSALDLSGTRVKSLPSGNFGCLPIAVYSATTWTALPCTSTGDNLLQQVFPVGSWGKQFLTAPLKKIATTASDNNVDIIRVFVNDPATVVTKTENGATTTLTGLISNSYYEFTSFRPTFLNADKAIQVVQYVTSQSCGSPATQADPEMVVLSSVEQTINDITVFSAHQNFVPPGQSQVTTHYLNVIMQTANTGAFKINGVAPTATWIPIPATNYSYLKEDISTRAGTNPVSRLTSDSGFSAIAYGFGNVESYGYNAGTNVKDLYQQIGVQTQYGIETSPSVCTSSPFQFKVSLPYIPDSMYWDFHNAAGMLPNNSNVMVNNIGNVAEDSATVVNGKTIHWYSLPTLYNFSNVGVYPVTITTYVPNGDCGTTQEINFDLTVSAPPVADYAWTAGGCVAEPYQFTEITPQFPKPTYYFYWNFDDPGSGSNNTSSLRNPVHTFSSPGIHNVKYFAITTPGCFSDTIVHQVNVPDLPDAVISGNNTVCINSTAPVPVTFTGSQGTAEYVFSYSIDDGSGPGPVLTTPVSTGGSFTVNAPTNVAGTFIYNLVGVKNANPAGTPCTRNISGQSVTINITPDATVMLSSAPGTDNQSLCINTPITNITYTVGGSGNGGAVSGLPPGVTGIYAAGVITISGTPTAVGTYNYTVTTTGPCLTPATNGIIVVNPDATITLTSATGTTSQELCRNSSITNITYAISGGGTGGNVVFTPALPGVTGTYAGGIFTISGAPTLAGLFNYTVTTTGTCVQHSLSGSILVNQLPSAAFTYTAPTCETRVMGFNDGSAPNIGVLDLWSWDFGDASPTSPLQNPTHTYAAAGPYSVTLTVRNTKGCISDPIASTIVNIDNRPEAGFIIPEVCLSDTYAQFIDTSKLTNAAIDRWDWNFGDPGSGPLNTSTLQNPTHSYAAVGPYTVRLIVWNNAKGCRDTIIQTLIVNGSFPVANFTVNNPATLCANDSVAIVEASTVFPGNITKIEIYWDNTNFPAVFETDNTPFTGKIYRHLYPNFQAPLTRVFQVRYRAYSGGICVNDKLANITVNAAPLVQFSNIPNTCLLVPPFQLTQASEIGGVPGSGIYSGPGVSVSGLFTPSVAGVGTHTILYTYTSAAAGCIDTMSNTITVLDTAHAVFTWVSPSCEQLPTSFTDISTAPANVSLANTVWDFGDLSPVENHAPGSTFGHLFPGPGIYNVTMYNVSAVGCRSSVFSNPVTIDPNHSISLNAGSNAVQSVCINTAIVPILYTLGGGATGATVSGLPAGVNYAVSGNTLTISGTPNTATGGPVFSFTISTTGNTCVVANAAGTITVLPDHIISLNAGDTAQSVCVNTPIDPILYDLGGGATGVTIAGLPPGVTYAVSGTILTISGTPASTTSGPLFNYTITTTGNACLIATTIGEIRVNPYPVAGFTFDKPDYCIPNAVVKLTNTSSMPDGSGMTYLWDLGDGTLPQPRSLHVNHWYASQGPFNVSLSVASMAVLNNNVIGCTTNITKPLTTIHPQPKADFVFSKQGVCIGDNVLITDNTDGKDGLVNQWHWDMGNSTVVTTNPVNYTFADTITYKITLYTINSFGCNSDTISKPFTVYPFPHVNAGPDKIVLEGGSVQLVGSAFANDPVYAWTPVEYLSDSKILNPRVLNPARDMTYRLTVTGRGGCAFSDDVFVKLLKFPVISNTFSPNGDGINDQWRIDYLNSYPDNRVQVFNRSGQLVFESKGYSAAWDGTIKGKPLPFDTYYYIIEPGNGRDPITGYVTIMK